MMFSETDTACQDMMIRQLPENVKSYIRSGVTITSFTQCVEELLLNSIDAGATNVAVRVDIGCFKVQVVDNGHGIPEEALPLIGNRYSTSKCHTVADLEDLRYFGYRGEALASIKDACGILEIVTRTKSSPKPLCKLFQDGKALPVKESAIPRPSVGTTITVHGLFMNFPVRQKSVNEGLELEKIRQRVAGLALMKPQVSVRLRNDAAGSTLVHTSKCSDSLITFSSLFGQIKAQALVEIQGLKGKYSVDGFIGREGSTKKDVQFVYINGRLVLKTEIHKVINQLMKKSAICKKKVDILSVSPVLDADVDVTRKSPGKQLDKHPMFIINVKCPLKDYDITFDPAKTLVEFKDWHTLLHLITEITSDFLKKEKLTINSTDQEYSNFKESKEGSTCFQSTLEISPSNVKDALISKAAKRFGKKQEVTVKTPEGLSLEEWKSENKTIDRLDLNVSKVTNDAICDDVPEKYSARCSDSEKGSSSRKADGDCDTYSNCDIVIHSSNDACEAANNNEGKNITSMPGNQIERQKRINSFNCDAHSAFIGHFQKAPVESTRKFQANPRSALSIFRRYVGKPFGNMPSGMSSNIDDRLKRISNILTSDRSMEEKSVSSLQRFRKFAANYAQKCERSVPDSQKESLPAKFKKINDVPKVPTDEVISVHDKTMMEKHLGTREKSGLMDQSNKITNNDTPEVVKMMVQTPTLASDRKRASEIVNEKSSKQIKIDGNETEKNPIASNDSNSFTCVHDAKSTDMANRILHSDGVSSEFDIYLHKVPNAFEAMRKDTSEQSNVNIQSSLCSENIALAIENGNVLANVDGSCSVKTYNNESKNSMVRGMDDSLEGIIGSQLFKNLPDVETTCFKDSDSPEMFTAIPVDTNKVIQSITAAGINLQDQRCSPALTQEFIPSTSSDETEKLKENWLHDDPSKEFSNNKTGERVESQLLSTTQEFTPGLMNEEQMSETSELSQGFTVEQIRPEKDMSIISDDTSPKSTGFTPIMEDNSSPIIDTASVSSAVTGTDKKETLEEITGSTNRDYMQANEVQKIETGTTQHEYDSQVMAVSQDTLEMPSICNCSRLDESDFELNKTKSPEMQKDNEIKDATEAEDSHLQTSNYHPEGLRFKDNNSDDITVTQLLGVKNQVSSDETCHESKDVLTFRDIFTPSQSQIDSNLYSGDTQTCYQFGKTLNHMDTGLTNESLENMLSETFDEESEEHIQSAQPTSFSKVTGKGKNRMIETPEQARNIQKGMPVVSARVSNMIEKINKDGEGQTDQEVSVNNTDLAKTSKNSTEEEDHTWIEMKHPESGKTVFIHSKLGTVVDSVNRDGEKLGLLSKDVIETPLTASTDESRKIRKRWQQNERIEMSTTVSVSSHLHELLCEHLQRDDENLDVKWRDKQIEHDVSTDTSSITKLFSEWDNPVFEAFCKPVLNAEAGVITNKSSLKALRSLHPCKFTKDMLKTVQVLGQLDKKFIVCLIQTDPYVTGPDVLAVIDQHAAHERVRIELLTEEAYVDGNTERGELAKFAVNPGKAIKMDQEEIQVMMSFRDEFSRIGITFRVDTHEDDMIRVLSVPECLVDKEASEAEKRGSIYWDTIQTLIKGHVELLMNTEGAKGRMPPVVHKLLCSQACHGAIKFGDKLSLEDCKSLIHDLSLCDLPFQCAHGRPSVMPILPVQHLETKLPQYQEKKQKPQLQKLCHAMKMKKVSTTDKP